MTPAAKAALRKETALRLAAPYTDSIQFLRSCREALHSLDPQEFRNSWSRKQLYISAKSWVREARAAQYAYEAAMPDRLNARRIA